LVTMGTEKGGIEEVWAHPFMAFRDYETGIRFQYKDTIYWLNDEPLRLRLTRRFSHGSTNFRVLILRRWSLMTGRSKRGDPL